MLFSIFNITNPLVSSLHYGSPLRFICSLMGLYSPPDGSKAPNAPALAQKEAPDKPNDGALIKFYPRPSLGLRFWGPLVPASDNREGLWTLVGIQTVFGLLCLRRSRSIGSSIVKREISKIPSLNRFSVTRGSMYVSEHGPTAFGSTNSFSRRGSNLWGFLRSTKFIALRKSLYLVGGTLLLSQSLLEACRLQILKYDPWYEEARSVREKQFFNNIIKYYHEGIDPTKFKVKDASNGAVLPLSSPEVKQSVAFARATLEADSWFTSWFGPIEYKPMSFTEYLDRLEYHLEMTDFIRNGRNNDAASQLLGRPLSHGTAELEELIQKNRSSRKKIGNLMESAPRQSMPVVSGQRQSSLKGILLDPNIQSSEDIDLDETWSAFNPWLDLALETSLSIKFLPTVLMADDATGDSSIDHSSEDDSNDPKPNY